ncbi:hypothetical protein D3C78_1392810 [compost metagenome]
MANAFTRTECLCLANRGLATRQPILNAAGDRASQSGCGRRGGRVLDSDDGGESVALGGNCHHSVGGSALRRRFCPDEKGRCRDAGSVSRGLAGARHAHRYLRFSANHVCDTAVNCHLYHCPERTDRQHCYPLAREISRA